MPVLSFDPNSKQPFQMDEEPKPKPKHCLVGLYSTPANDPILVRSSDGFGCWIGPSEAMMLLRRMRLADGECAERRGGERG